MRFTRQLIALRREHPVFRRPHFFRGNPNQGTSVKDIVWLTHEGGEATDDLWHFADARCSAFCLAVMRASYYYSQGGREELDDGFIVLMNAFHEAIEFKLPEAAMGHSWEVVFDTARAKPAAEP